MRVTRPPSITLLASLSLISGIHTAGAEPFGPDPGSQGEVELGIGYVSDENFTFGRYNGWNDDGAKAVVNLDYHQWQPDGILGGTLDFLDLNATDLGLDTRRAGLAFGTAGGFELGLDYDLLTSVNNFTGRTPFRGGSSLTLPAGWVASNTTGGMLGFDEVARRFDRELERERWQISLAKRLGTGLSLSTSFSTEEKEGTATLGGAFYVDASNGHSAILPRPVDYRTDDFDIALHFLRNNLSLDLSYLYSSFDNGSSGLSWQNPYGDSFGDPVDYPGGTGRIALEPDNEMHRFRLLGSYLLTQQLRLSIDGSYAEASQDDTFLPFTANPLITPGAPLPRNDLNAEVATTTFNAAAHYRPLSKLTLEAKWRYEDRDNDSPRDGYLYVRGDAWAPDDSRYTVYNAPHSRRLNRFELEAGYRLPLASRLGLTYSYEEIDRENAAVRETEEDIYKLVLSSRPASAWNARFELGYRDRAASTYHWDQSYYAYYDTGLINLIPDSQRYTNHPLLFQYHLANREAWDGKVSLGYSPGGDWSLNVDLMHSEYDYDKSYLGLQEENRDHATVSASFLPAEALNVVLYYSYDRYQNEQRGRAFRGGIEKNAFEIYPPLPQASDPDQDWKTEGDDETHSVGANLRWTINERLEAEADYSYVDSSGEQAFAAFGGPGLDDTDLPNLETTQHNILLRATYQLRDRVSLKFDYRYYRYEEDNWAIDGVRFDTLDKVLWTGESSPDDDIHFFQASVLYRLE